MPAPGYILALLFTVSFTLATWLQPLVSLWNESRAHSGNLLALVMGDARRMFAKHFFVKADVYFHSGYYPSIFDQGRATNEIHIAEQAGTDTHASPDHPAHDHNPAHGEPGHVHAEHEDHDHAAAGHAEHEHDFLKPPHDWIEAFGRNFFNTEHSELSGAGANEILPWLRISAELDPQQVDTYTVGAYFLATVLKRPQEAELFLREGQRANPDSSEILFELGRVYRDGFKDPFRARNLFQLATLKVEAEEKRTGESNLFMKRQILVSLSRLEEHEGNLREAILYLQKLHDAFPPENSATRQELAKQIAELTAKLPK